MHNEKASSESTDLRHYLGVIRRRKWSILVVVATVVAATMFFSFRQTPVYTSSARVYVTPLNVGTTPSLVNLETEKALIVSSKVASTVKKNLDLAAPADSLLGGLNVAVETNTEVLQIQYSDVDPAHAERMAQGFAEAYLQFRSLQAVEDVKAQLDAKEAQVTQAEEELVALEQRLRQAGTPAERDVLTQERDSLEALLLVLQQELQSLRLSSAVSASGGEIVDDAERPVSPASPKHTQNAILGILIGLVMGFGVAFLRDRLDDRLHGRDDLEEQLRAPVLATIPKVENWKRREETEVISLDAPKSPPAEAYRTLRTNLQFIARTDRFRILAVTSPSAGEGKTTTVANLAVTMAFTGKRVIAVSCDLRKPRLHQFFGLDNRHGVTTILAGEADLEGAIQRPAVENLRVLASGPVPPNPAELLGSDEMDDLLGKLREIADFVILDTPPVLAVADPLILGSKSDGILIVTDATSTTRASAAHVREQLEQVDANIVGGVFNNFDPSTARTYTPYYGGGYAYRDEEKADVSGNGQAPREKASQRSSSGDVWS